MMRKLKELLSSPPTLEKIDYECRRLVVLTVDANLIKIGWIIGQDNECNEKYTVKFGAKVLNSHQRAYAQIKREL